MQIPLPIGKQIRKIRLHLGHTQREVSRAVGVSISHLSDIERGRDSPTHKLVNKLIEYFETYGYDVDRFYMTVSTDVARGKVHLNDLSLEHKLLVASLASARLNKEQGDKLWKFLKELNYES